MVGCWKDERMRVGKRLKLTLQDFWTTRCRLPWRGMISFDKIYELKESSMFSWIILEHVVRASFSQYRVSFSKLCLLYMWRFHSWVCDSQSCLDDMTSLPKCQNVRISYRQKLECEPNMAKENPTQVSTLWIKRNTWHSFYNNGILVACIEPTQSGDPSVWHPESTHTTTLASGRSVTTRRSMLVQKAGKNGNQPWSYCRWHLRERGVGWVWRVWVARLQKSWNW